jgi:hypothetical protein
MARFRDPSGPSPFGSPRGRRLAALACALAALFGPSLAAAEPTRIDVRVISKGAKFVGTSMGGVLVVIRDAETGEQLARGVTRGGTGDTARIMSASLRHHDPVATPDAAVFGTTLDLAEPRPLEVSAFGPLAQRQAANRVSQTMWVVPGRHVTGGDGWLLELPGFSVDVLEPPAHEKLGGETTAVTVRANVTMMCGCPVEPGGLWDASRFDVRAHVIRDGRSVAEVPLRFAGETSQFESEVEIREAGSYEVVVFAHDPANGNTGLDRTTFEVERRNR